MQQVKFTQMKDGTAEEYQFLNSLEVPFANKCGERILTYMQGLGDSLEGYQISRLQHSLQTATRAHRDNADIDIVVGALLHDIGDLLSPYNHAEFAAAIIKPYTHEKCTWIVEKHALFQKYYYAHHHNGNKNERDKFKKHPYYQDCINFCENYDQASFDPSYNTENLEFFAPMVKQVFSRKPNFQL